MLKKTVSTLYISLAFLLLSLPGKSMDQPKWSHFDENVFVKAKKEHKLVLLHLRANWCHWCHVMEEKTYANPRVLSSLNKDYIACSEDHDERQDLTSLYSDYGWPATIIFDENGNELFKEAGYIEAGDFLVTLAKLRKNPNSITNNIVNTNIKSATALSKQNSLRKLKAMFYSSLDIENGGFSFPQKYLDFETFEYALNHYKTDASLKKWLYTSVVNSAGIYDKEWGGIFQYSTNGDWNHVHYEKLLSKQAGYIKMYCWYFKLFNDSAALQKAEGIASYVNRFLTASNGGFYNAQDADLIKGEKATAYFALPDAQRIAKGIPAIDSNIYTSDNAQFAEALTILWATSSKQIYLDKAIKCVSYLQSNRKKENTYKHGERFVATISLKDNISMLKTLLLLYRSTQQPVYKITAKELLKEIVKTFNSGNGYLYTYVGSSAIKATYNVSENIEACRLLNYASHLLEEPVYKKTAAEIFNFLTNAKLVATLSTEPGILSAASELKEEPITAALLIKKEATLKENYLLTTVSFPKFYFNSMVYTKDNIIEDKKGLFDSLDESCIVLCTSSYCSSPQFTHEGFSK